MKLRFDEEDHAYFLDGKRVKAVTSVAKIPLDTYKLEQFSKRMVVTGMARRPDLVEQAAAHIGDDRVLNGIAQDAEKEAKADGGARRGTAVHRITDRIDGGEEIVPTALASHVQATWEELWTASELEVIPEYMERIVVYPDLKVCGKLDRIGRTRKGVLVVCDTKTGKWELAFPHSAAAQLALYANAPLLAAPLDRYGETTDFEPMPEVSKKWGVLIHMPEEGEHQTVRLDIERGWSAVQQSCLTAIEWRSVRARDLVFPLAKIARPSTPTFDEGADLTEFEVTSLRNDFKTCATRSVADRWLKESVDSGSSFNIAGPGCRPTQRRLHIIRAAIAWSDQPDDVVHAAINYIASPAVGGASIGSRLGALTTNHAEALQIAAAQLDDGAIHLTFAEDGTPVLADTPLSVA